MTEAEYYTDLLRTVFRGRRVIVAVDVLVAAGSMAARLRDLGAEPVLALSGTRGTGDVPDDLENVMLAQDTATTIMENIRGFEAALQDLPREALDTLDRVDPDGEALVIGSFFTPPGTIGGRRLYGGRPDAWAALEDKIVVDEFFDRAGIARTESVVVSTDDIRATMARFDRGLGVVVAGDAKEGFHGAAEYLRWIRTDEDLSDAEPFFNTHCDKVRVMPFLEGIPCSIHGAVVGETTIALRPVEMITLRRPQTKLLYAGTATYWDPPDADRDYMRDVARRVGEALQTNYDYRGAFTVDGVVTEEGFRPTELNPRAGAGTGPITGPSGVPFQLVNKMLIEREDFDFRPSDLEGLILDNADHKRSGGAYASLVGEPFEQANHPIVRTENHYRLAEKHETSTGSITLGSSGIGRFVLFAPDPATIEVGPSFAPHAVDAFALIDREFETGIGPLEAANDLR